MRLICFIFLFFICAFIPSNDIAKRDFYYRITRNYCSDAYEILKSEPENKSFTKYVQGKTELDWLEGFGTAIHETCHNYNFKISQTNSYNLDEGYFISNGIKIVVPKMTCYNTIELNKFVPITIQKNIFRYDLYIGNNSKKESNHSQIAGIYGLLDEFSAYYHGTKAQIELFKFYDSLSFKSPSKYWLKYLECFQSELCSYYEFQLFVSWYLQFAKKYHNDVYKDCFDNMSLRVVYTMLDNEWALLIKDYFDKRNQIIDKLYKRGYKVEIEDDKDIVINKYSRDKKYYFWIIGKDGSDGIGIYTVEMEYLKTLIQDSTLRELDKFRIDGVNAKNYNKYLE